MFRNLAIVALLLAVGALTSAGLLLYVGNPLPAVPLTVLGVGAVASLVGAIGF